METQLRGAIITTGLSGCIERILGGDVRAQDLQTLFFSVRQESGGKGIVREISNFVAHPEPRTQGIIRDALHDFYTFMKFRAPLETSRLEMTDIPATVDRRMSDTSHRDLAAVLPYAEPVLVSPPPIPL